MEAAKQSGRGTPLLPSPLLSFPWLKLGVDRVLRPRVTFAAEEEVVGFSDSSRFTPGVGPKPATGD